MLLRNLLRYDDEMIKGTLPDAWDIGLQFYNKVQE